MTYSVKEAFYSLQGEGRHAGTPAVFVRLSGCNIWSGRETDRVRDSAKGVCALWCDTDFRGTDGSNGGQYDAVSLAELAKSLGPDAPIVVLTGGEPSLQIDEQLVAALRSRGFRVHVETNGTRMLPPVDWVTVSPKPPSVVLQQHYNEVKVVFGIDVERFASLAPEKFIQPCSGEYDKCIRYVMNHPWWRLSVQTHKVLGLP